MIRLTLVFRSTTAYWPRDDVLPAGDRDIAEQGDDAGIGIIDPVIAAADIGRVPDDDVALRVDPADPRALAVGAERIDRAAAASAAPGAACAGAVLAEQAAPGLAAARASGGRAGRLGHIARSARRPGCACRRGCAIASPRATAICCASYHSRLSCAVTNVGRRGHLQRLAGDDRDLPVDIVDRPGRRPRCWLSPLDHDMAVGVEAIDLVVRLRRSCFCSGGNARSGYRRAPRWCRAWPRRCRGRYRPAACCCHSMP